MKSLSDFISSVSGNILLLGEPGCGKTTLATQLPSPYFLECDMNLKGPIDTIKRFNLKADFTYDIPHILDDGSLVSRPKRYKRFAELAFAACINPVVKTVIVDSLTTWQFYLEDEVRLQQGRKIADGEKQLIDEPLAIQDWRPFAGLAKEVIIRMKASGKLIVFIGHIDNRPDETKETPKDASGAALLRYINFPGQLRLTMGGLFDDVWVMSSERKMVNGKLESVRTLQTSPNDYRDSGLGLKTSIGLTHKFDVNYNELNKLIAK